ncbi:hypothetical protein BBJ28_00022158, partial [Nothophytophthora sp. Chile5]
MAPGALRAASVGGMAPILAATALSSYADRRAALNAPPVSSKTTSSDCVSATALLILRGVGAGLAWTIGVDGYMLASVTDAEWRERLVARPGSTVRREVARTMVRLSARNMLGFASFLGIFGGVSCSLEKLRGRTDLLNPFMGGFIAGMAVLPAELQVDLHRGGGNRYNNVGRMGITREEFTHIHQECAHLVLVLVANKIRVQVPLRTSSSPASTISIGGTDAASQVQWAVKVMPTTSPAAAPVVAPVAVTAAAPHMEPVVMDEFRMLLHDRYDGKRSIRQAFLTWDSDKDGCLTPRELQEMITRLGFAPALGPEKEDESAMEQLDAEHVLDLLRTKYESHKLRQVFRDWDMDKNGGVTLLELESNLRRQGVRIAKSQLQELFDAHDLNHDGRLLYDEFMRLVYGPTHQRRGNGMRSRHRQQPQNDENGVAAEEDPFNFLRSTAMSQPSTLLTNDPGFRATLQRKLRAFAPRLNDAYAAFDDDHSGNLSYREFRQG